MFTPNIKYSEFYGGNDENFAQTFFRGVKIIVKELSEKIDYTHNSVNINNLAYKQNSKYNNYKFSCILTKYKEDGIFIIKNEKWKTITIVCAVSFDEPETNWYKNFDRTALYALNSEYDKDEIIKGEDPENYAIDKIIDDKLVYATIENGGYAVIKGSKLGSNISVSTDGTYNSIGFEYNSHKYLIEFSGDGEIEVDDFSNTSYLYNFKIKDVTDTDNSFYVFSEYEYVNSGLILYKGYKNYYKNKFSKIGFKEIFENINSLNKEIINYIIVDKAGNVSTETDFIIELVQQNNILKSKYITRILDENKPSSFNTNENIGASI